MITPKIGLRNEILGLKKQYTVTRDTNFLMKSAILKGVYYALGGTKVIPLPPEYSTITKIIKAIAKTNLALSKEIERDVKKLNTELQKETNNRLSAVTIYSAKLIYLDIIDNVTQEVLVDTALYKQLKTYQLAEIGEILIKRYSTIPGITNSLNIGTYIHGLLRDSMCTTE